VPPGRELEPALEQVARLQGVARVHAAGLARGPDAAVLAPNPRAKSEGAMASEGRKAYEGGGMFVTVRRYRLIEGSLDDLTQRVEEGFAEQIRAQAGFRSYQFLDCGDGVVMTISTFREAREAEASRDLAQRWTDENLQDLRFTRLESFGGEVLVSRGVAPV
jgi:hypothetical protein